MDKSDTSELFKPLERAISETFIPSILGREISVSDREMFALPIRAGERVRESEKASFVPLVFTTSGGMAPECAAFMKQVAHQLADKRKDDYAAVANYIRTKIRFALLKSVLISLRGVRGKQRKDAALPTSAGDFGLIPECDAYEAY